MTKSRRGKIYIDDEGWGPDAGSIEYGYRVSFGGIHVFVSQIGEPGPEPDNCTDLVETAQRAKPAQAQPGVKRVFVGCIHAEELSEGPKDGGETAVPSDGDSSAGSTDSLHQVQDGALGAIPMVLVFRTSVSRQIGQESLWLGLNPDKTLQPRPQLLPG